MKNQPGAASQGVRYFRSKFEDVCDPGCGDGLISEHTAVVSETGDASRGLPATNFKEKLLLLF